MRQLIMLELDPSTLRRAIGGGSYARGAEYARQRAVQHVTRDAEETALHGRDRSRTGDSRWTRCWTAAAPPVAV
jgi:hypothetical protein